MAKLTGINFFLFQFFYNLLLKFFQFITNQRFHRTGITCGCCRRIQDHRAHQAQNVAQTSCNTHVGIN
uniref:Uncharacterized protein n=1 Tax=Anopheles atroparvus TaxID=41427 RepID=A0AAG5DLF4_ANOAO